VQNYNKETNHWGLEASISSLRDEGLQTRKGLLVGESRCLITEIIESNYKKGMELHTSVPSDDRIELGLDLACSSGKHTAANNTVYIVVAV